MLWIHCMNDKCCFFDARYVSKIRAERHDAAVDSLRGMTDNFILLPDENVD